MATARNTTRRTGRRTGRAVHGISAEFSMMIQAAVMLAIGIFVTSQIFQAIPDSNALPNATTAVQDLTGQAFEIAPIVLIVIVAVLILSFVRGL